MAGPAAIGAEAPAWRRAWHDSSVPVAIILVAVVILAGIVVVAMGYGGELARPAADEPEATDFTSWSDVASYRPPAALLGYHAGATEHAFQRISRSLAERDAEIAWLRLKLRELQPEGERQGGRLAGLSVPVPAEPAPRPRSSPRPEPPDARPEPPAARPEPPDARPEPAGALPGSAGPVPGLSDLPDGSARPALMPAGPESPRLGPEGQGPGLPDRLAATDADAARAPAAPPPPEPERPAGSVAQAFVGEDK